MSNRLSLTRNQELVYSRLADSDRALSAYDILDALRAEGLRAPIQIYRALQKLADRGLIHRIESLNAFIACAHEGHQEAVGFAICTACGEVEEFPLPESMSAIDHWASLRTFQVEHATVEVRGRCQACR
jgi:Fur family zinc uptake transcriptional regulator